MGIFDATPIRGVESNPGIDTASTLASAVGQREPGKRGRHKATCDCSTCATRRNSGVASSEEKNDLAQKARERISNPENWKPVVSLIPNLQYAATGWEGFKLTDPEEELLAGHMGAAAIELGLVDVRYMNTFMLIAAMGTIYGRRSVEYYRLKKKNDDTKQAK